jgi:hypothetical protein
MSSTQAACLPDRIVEHAVDHGRLFRPVGRHRLAGGLVGGCMYGCQAGESCHSP